MSGQDYRVRECIHRSRGAAGDFYKGDTYINCLKRLRSAAAVSFAGKVTAFFWADAAQVLVWLCRDCAGELGLGDREPNSVH